MPATCQPDLFGQEPPPLTAKNLRIVRQSRAALSKEQGKFNKLLAEVQRLQNRLAAWQAFAEKQQQQVSVVLTPLLETVRQARRNLIRTCADILDEKHGGDVPRKAERRLLIAVLLEICETCFVEPGGEDPEVIAIYDGYSPTTHAEHQRAQATEFRDEVLETYGIDIPEEVRLDDLEEFLRSAFASSAGQGPFETDPNELPKKKRSRKTRNGADSPNEADIASVDPRQSVRDVYRKLASALHPDRAADDEDRFRRHELMQRVNLAYEGIDLLALLELQLEIQQIDEDHMATIPETRLQQYNLVLRDRVDLLKREVTAITDHFRMTMQRVPRSMTPEAVEREFECHLEELRDDVAELQEWAAAMPLTAYRKAWLKGWEREKKEEERRLKNLDVMGLINFELVGGVSFSFDARSPGRERGPRKKSQR